MKIHKIYFKFKIGISTNMFEGGKNQEQYSVSQPKIIIFPLLDSLPLNMCKFNISLNSKELFLG